MTPVVRLDTARPVAYIRRSVEKRRPEDRDDGAGQRAEIAALAERRGQTIAPDDVYAKDWNISGQREKREKREDMARILAGIRAGEVTDVYVYAVDRLARDDAYGLTIRDACEDAGVLVHSVAERCTFDMSNDRDRDYWGRQVTQAADQGRRYTRVNLDTKVESRRHIETCTKVGRTHRGDCDQRCIPGDHCAYKHDLGGQLVYGSDPDRPAEDAAAVVAAYRKAGSFLGAVRALNAAGVPTRRGKLWTVRSVAVLVRREAPEVAPVILARKGVSAKRTRLFAVLLTCRCGSTLTSAPRPGRKRLDGSVGPGSIAYYCRAGHLDTRHGVPYMVSEPKVLRWARIEASRTSKMLRVPVETVKRDAQTGEVIAGTARRVAVSPATIAAKRTAIVDLAADLTITPDDARRRLAKLDAQSKSAQAAERAYMILGRGPRVDWTLPPAEVNATLRTIWAEVKLGPDMLPVKAEWIVSPDWTPDDPEPPRDADRDALDAVRDRALPDLTD